MYQKRYDCLEVGLPKLDIKDVILHGGIKVYLFGVERTGDLREGLMISSCIQQDGNCGNHNQSSIVKKCARSSVATQKQISIDGWWSMSKIGKHSHRKQQQGKSSTTPWHILSSVLIAITQYLLRKDWKQWKREEGRSRRKITFIEPRPQKQNIFGRFVVVVVVVDCNINSLFFFHLFFLAVHLLSKTYAIFRSPLFIPKSLCIFLLFLSLFHRAGS